MYEQYGEYQDVKYYLDNKESFRKTYPNKSIIIKHQEVKGVFDTYAQAYHYASDLYPDEDYYIQLCYSREDRYNKR
jgi:hypothetical protein